MKRLLLASTGGHLTELAMLSARLSPVADDEVWVTFDHPQSRELLRAETVEFVADTPPRDWRRVVGNLRRADELLRRHRPDQLVTNGAGIALSFAPLALARGIETHYIECSARAQAPSLTGKLLQRLPSIRLYAQDVAFARGKWHHRGSVFDNYVVEVADPRPPIRKVVVTVGSLSFSFRRLLDRLPSILPPGIDVLLQVGVDVDSIRWPGARVVRTLPPDDLSTEMATADVVIAHSGIGSALAALNAGRVPILVPRLHRFNEHVDNHQQEIAISLARRGLAQHVDASQLAPGDLDHVAGRSVRHAGVSPFVLA